MGCCEFLEDCGFYRKYGHKSGEVWQGLFAAYCRGELVSICERWRAYRQKSRNLADDMTPCGELMPGSVTLIL